jgi:Ca2+-binding RTX toxin-like protein
VPNAREMRVVATILLCLVFAADAHGATVSVTGATLHVTAAPGEVNQVAIAPASGVLSVTDAGTPLTAGGGCVAAGAAVECASLPLLDLAVDLGDGDDTLITTAALPLLVTDGDGVDSITGGAAADTFIASPGADRYQGGGGSDLVSYAARSDAVVADVDNAADDGAAGEGDDIRTDVELIAGGAAGDTLSGDGSAEVLTGGAGDDRLAGNGGNDSLDGGAGADTLDGGSGTDTVDFSARTQPLVVDLAATTGQEDAFASVENAIGGAGGDRLIGTTAANTLQGGPGDDVLDGRTGADRLEGGPGIDAAEYASRTTAVTADLDGNNDDGTSSERDRITTDVERLIGGSSSDRLTGSNGANLLVGGAGNDILDGNGGDDALDAGAGDDRVWGDAGNDSFTLATGKDQAWGGDGNDAFAGGDNEDVLYGENGDDHVAGGAGNDTLSGGDANDSLYGEAGNDTLRGEAGNDSLAGEAGNDVLSGDAGDDVLDGSFGGDDLSGGDGNDRLLGSDDGDALNGGAGVDRLSGGDGADSLSGGVDDDVLAGGAGGDELKGDEGWDTADYTGRREALAIDIDDRRDDGATGEGDNVRASVETVIGGAGSDKLTGSAASNYLYGEGGNDRVDGGAGSDRVYGGAGKDTIIGGAGPDSLDGGDGADRMVARDGSREAVRCGGSRDRASTDTVDMLFGCEKRTSGTWNWSNKDRKKAGRVRGVRARTGGGRFVGIPGFPGERIDRRLLADIAYLQRKYRIHISDGYARTGHAKHGEHPIGLAIDIVPGPGGSWSDIDRLAKWAEPRQNRPRSPFRWVGYNGDRNHGRGNHLHLSWRHTSTRRGRPARTVWTLSIAR